MIVQQILVKSYLGSEPVVRQITDLIEARYSNLFHAVLVHGSVASNEVVSYSDFDGLLIIHDNYKNSIELSKFIRDSMQLIYRFDPFQHHGWFIITKDELLDYPEHYLPHAVLTNARVLYPRDNAMTMNIAYNETNYYSQNLAVILKGIDKKLSSAWRPRNAYQLKGFLSQIMLLPTLYYSAKTNRGICKRDSFTLAEPDFTEDAWRLQQIASQMRDRWNYKSGVVYRSILKLNCRVTRKVAQTYLAPPMSNSDKNLVNGEFLDLLQGFINEVRINLKEVDKLQ